MWRRDSLKRPPAVEKSVKNPKIFKFVGSSYIDEVLKKGTFRISSDSHFRDLEANALRKRGIGDRLENVSEAVFEGHHLIDDSTAIAPPGVTPGLQFSQPMRIKNLRFTYEGSSFYLFSMSRGDLISLTRTMCDIPPPDERYDACIQVVSVKKLARAIYDHGVALLETSRAPIRKLFSGLVCGRINYIPMSVGGGAPQLHSPSPFNKDIFFQNQSEERIVFRRLSGIRLPPVLSLQITHPSRYFTEIFRNRGPKTFLSIQKAAAAAAIPRQRQ
jgi:hypothetical protein